MLAELTVWVAAYWLHVVIIFVVGGLVGIGLQSVIEDLRIRRENARIIKSGRGRG